MKNIGKDLLLPQQTDPTKEDLMLVLGDDPETAKQAAAAFNQASCHVLLVFAPIFHHYMAHMLSFK